jgi:hypothetical protein
MKKSVLVLVLLIPFQLMALDLQRETQRLCNDVDRLQPGSFHYFDCLHHAKSIVNGSLGLIEGFYNICHESWLDEPLFCYSRISKKFYSRLVPADQVTPAQESRLREIILTNSLKLEQIPSRYKPSDDLRFNRVLISIEELFDYARGKRLNALDTLILTCSRASDWSFLLKADEDEAYDAAKRCFKESLRWYQTEL